MSALNSLDEGGGVSGAEDITLPLGRRRDVLCTLWLATAGLGGPLLGTDEENVVFLRLAVYHVTKKQIIAEHSFPIRPPATTHSSNNNASSSGGHMDEGGRDHSRDPSAPNGGAVPPMPNLSETCRRDYQLSEDQLRGADSMGAVLLQVEDILDKITESLDNNTPYTNIHSSSNNHNNHHNHTNSNSSPSHHDSNTTSNNTTQRNNSSSSNVAESISVNRPVIVTDGQNHIRQVLHPKANFHGVELPKTYNTFFDLRKEFRSCYQQPDECPSFQEMAKFHNLPIADDDNLAVRATTTMITIIERMVQDGHEFRNPEVVLTKLETCPVARGEDVDSGCVVRARGLPWMSVDTQVADFFRGLNVAKGGVALCLSPQGRRNGEALIRFLSSEHRDMALKRHKHHMGGRYIEVYKATGEDFVSVAGGNNNEATQFLARGNLIIRMRGLPYDCTARQVVDFFESGASGVKLVDNEEGVLFVRKPDGRATGDAFVMLSQEEDMVKALLKHRDLIGSRYIELFRSTSAEVMNRSMDIRHMEQQPQPLPPLIAQLPSMPPLLPQQSVAHGPRKDCVRLRGLPFEAQIEHVLGFLGEFGKNIIFRGVHMVYTPQGQPTGEAFIQMNSEHAAWACTQNRHNRYIQFGKKNRYIEVFQCSGDDMNIVLSGATSAGAVTATTAPPVRSIVPAPGGSPMLSPYGAYPLGPAPPVLSHPLTPTARLAPYPTTIAAPYPMFYWPYPSPPVSPTSAYYSSIPHHTIIPSECIPLHGTGELTMHPGEAVATM